jgi:molecular chaperone GrpE (heat shock protein)
MLDAGTEDDAPHRNSTAPAAAGQAELEASVRALKTQLEERDATILHLLSEVTNLKEKLKSQSESPLPPLPSQSAKG